VFGLSCQRSFATQPLAANKSASKDAVKIQSHPLLMWQSGVGCIFFCGLFNMHALDDDISLNKTSNHQTI
jgi:hypothetical protein